MSFDEKRRIHYFHSEATAIGGHVTGPFVRDIPVQSPGTLPPPGGFYETSTIDFRFENIVAAKATRTRVEGNMLGDIAKTSMLAVVEDLHVVERVHVDQAVAYISTEHPIEAPYVPRVDFGATNISGLRVDNAVLKVHFALDLLKTRNNGGFPRTSPLEDDKLKERGKFNAGRGLLQCSLATQIELIDGELKGEIIQPNVLKIPDVGLIHVAELLMTCDSYELIMLRFELGCAVKADVTAAAGKVNGGGH
jgi:hypothetical protein